jgi:hypothetical protein
VENQTADPAATIREVGLPIYQSKWWLKFLGILSIIQGIMIALSIVGIIIAWLPIWIGVILYQSATTVELAYTSGDKLTLFRALDKLKLYFTIQGIMTLIGIIVGAMALTMGVLGAIIETFT